MPYNIPNEKVGCAMFYAVSWTALVVCIAFWIRSNWVEDCVYEYWRLDDEPWQYFTRE